MEAIRDPRGNSLAGGGTQFGRRQAIAAWPCSPRAVNMSMNMSMVCSSLAGKQIGRVVALHGAGQEGHALQVPGRARLGSLRPARAEADDPGGGLTAAIADLLAGHLADRDRRALIVRLPRCANSSSSSGPAAA
jgi:hypothetical protein